MALTKITRTNTQLPSHPFNAIGHNGLLGEWRGALSNLARRVGNDNEVISAKILQIQEILKPIKTINGAQPIGTYIRNMIMLTAKDTIDSFKSICEDLGLNMDTEFKKINNRIASEKKNLEVVIKKYGDVKVPEFRVEVEDVIEKVEVYKPEGKMNAEFVEPVEIKVEVEDAPDEEEVEPVEIKVEVDDAPDEEEVEEEVEPVEVKVEGAPYEEEVEVRDEEKDILQEKLERLEQETDLLQEQLERSRQETDLLQEQLERSRQETDNAVRMAEVAERARQERENAEKEIEKARERIDTLDERQNRLLNKAEEHKRNFEKAEQELERATRKVEQKDAKIERLETEKAEIVHRIEAEVHRLNDSLAQAQNDVLDAREQNIQINNELCTEREYGRQTKDELEATKATLELIQSDDAATTRAVDALLSRGITMLTIREMEELELLRERSQSFNNRLIEADQRYQNVTREMLQEAARVDDTNRKVVELEYKLADKERNIADVKRNLNNLEIETQTIKEELQDKKDKEEIRQKELDDAKANVDRYEQIITSNMEYMSSRLDKEAKKRHQIEEEFKASKLARDTSEERLQDQYIEIKNLQEKSARQQEEFQREKQNLEQKISDQEAELADLNDVIYIMTEKSARQQEEFQREKQNLQQEIDDTKRELVDLNRQMLHKENIYKGLENEKIELEKQKADLLGQGRAKDGKLDLLEKKLARNEEIKLRLEEETKELRQELNDEKEKLQEAEQEKGTLVLKHTQKVNELQEQIEEAKEEKVELERKILNANNLLRQQEQDIINTQDELDREINICEKAKEEKNEIALKLQAAKQEKEDIEERYNSIAEYKNLYDMTVNTTATAQLRLEHVLENLKSSSNIGKSIIKLSHKFTNSTNNNILLCSRDLGEQIASWTINTKSKPFESLKSTVTSIANPQVKSLVAYAGISVLFKQKDILLQNLKTKNTVVQYTLASKAIESFASSTEQKGRGIQNPKGFFKKEIVKVYKLDEFLSNEGNYYFDIFTKSNGIIRDDSIDELLNLVKFAYDIEENNIEISIAGWAYHTD